MKTNHLIAVAGNMLAGNFNIRTQKKPIGSTAGSLAWMLCQPIQARFHESEYFFYRYRVAEVSAGEHWEPVAAQGAFPDSELTDWNYCEGIHSLPLVTRRPWGSFFSGDPILTAGAEKLLDSIVKHVRAEFVNWLDDSEGAETIKIQLI